MEDLKLYLFHLCSPKGRVSILSGLYIQNVFVFWHERDKTMASSKDYLDYILEQLSGLDDISYCAMMGEYIIYYRGKVVGGIYDDRFLVKPVKSAVAMMPNADRELP